MKKLNFDKLYIKAENYHSFVTKDKDICYRREGSIAFCYVEQQKENDFHYITKKDLEESGLSDDDLYSIAEDRMKEIPSLQGHKANETGLFVWSGTELEITRMLLYISDLIEVCINALGLDSERKVVVIPVTSKEFYLDFNYNQDAVSLFSNFCKLQSYCDGGRLANYPMIYEKSVLVYSYFEYLGKEIQITEEAQILYEISLSCIGTRNDKFAISLLEQAIGSKVEPDPKLKAAIYTTLCSCYLNTLEVKKSGDYKQDQTLELIKKYVSIALNCNPQNKVAPQLLVQTYLLENNIVSACEVIAKYDVNLEKQSIDNFQATHNRMQEDSLSRRYLYLTLQTLLVNQCREDLSLFDKLYEIHENCYESSNFSKLLIIVAGVIGQNIALTGLYHDYFRYASQEDEGKTEYFTQLVNALYHFSQFGDEHEIHKILQDTDECFDTIKDSITDELKGCYYINRTTALKHLNKQDEIIKMYDHLEPKYRDNTMLYNVSFSLYANNCFIDAQRVILAAILEKADELDYCLAGDIFMAMKDYDRAIQYYTASIEYIKESKDKPYVNSLGKMVEPINLNKKQESYLLVFPKIMQAYSTLGNSQLLQAIFDKFNELVDSCREKTEIETTYSVFLNLYKQKEEVCNQYEITKEELEKTKEEKSELVKRANEWYKKLLQIQLIDTKTEIDDEMWETEISKDMDGVIDSIKTICVREKSKDYRQIREHIVARFKEIHKCRQAFEFLCTAETFYYAFEKDDDLMDFAPVYVEYCRAIETLLWAYIQQSDEYRENGEKEKKYRNQGMTFGAANSTIRHTKNGTLLKYLNHLEEFRANRNNSAHINVSIEPNVRNLRDYLWNTDIIDVLLTY